MTIYLENPKEFMEKTYYKQFTGTKIDTQINGAE